MALCLGVSQTGCAVYRASRLPTHPIESFRTTVTHEGVTLGAELLYSKTQSKLYFDTDLTKRALVPVHVGIANRREEETARLRVSAMRLTASNLAEPAFPVPFDEVAERMRRKSLGPAIAWGTLGLATLIFALLFVPMGSALAVSQTASVNERVTQDVWNKSLKDADLAPGGKTSGVVFFLVPKEARSLTEPRLRCVLAVGERPTELELEGLLQ